MTQEQLGNILGLSRKAIEGIESGRNSNIRADKIKLLCETFHEYPGFLLYGHGHGHGYWSRMFSSKVGADKDSLYPSSHGVSNKNMLLMIRKTIEDVIGSKAFPLMNSIYLLNEDGLSRAETLIDDLLKIGDYRKNT